MKAPINKEQDEPIKCETIFKMLVTETQILPLLLLLQ